MRTKAWAAVLAAVAVTAAAGGGSATAHPTREETLRAEKERLRAEQAAVRARLQSAVSRIATTQEQLAATERRLEIAARELDGIRAQLHLAAQAHAEAQARADAAARELQRRTRHLAAVEDRLERETATLHTQAAEAYKYGAQPLRAVGHILRSGSPTEAVHTIRLVGAVVRTQAGTVDTVADLQREASRARREAEASQQRRAAEEGRLREARDVLAVLSERRESAVAAMRRDRADRAGLLADLQAQRRALAARERVLGAGLAEVDAAIREEARRRAEEARRRAEQARRRAAGAGRLACPMPGAWFMNDWGFPRSGGRRHEGTDMFDDQGVPVYAVANGTVRRVDRVDRYPAGDLGGITLSFWTAPDEYWYYAHLDAVVEGLDPGDRVWAGQHVGWNGNTGNAAGTPPHTHVGRYIGGAAVNPYPGLRDACGN